MVVGNIYLPYSLVFGHSQLSLYVCVSVCVSSPSLPYPLAREERIAKAEEQRRAAEEARAASEQETKLRLDAMFAQLRDVRIRHICVCACVCRALRENALFSTCAYFSDR